MKSSCMAPFSHMSISPDGKVRLCCNDSLVEMVLGDLSDEKLI